MNELVGPTVFKALLSIATGGLAGVWLVYDAINLWRARGADRRDPIVGDKRFGYVIGMTIGVIGLYGVARFNGLL